MVMLASQQAKEDLQKKGHLGWPWKDDESFTFGGEDSGGWCSGGGRKETSMEL